MAIGQLRTVVVDYADPAPLAEFWAAVLGAEAAYTGDEFCLVHLPGSTGP